MQIYRVLNTEGGAESWFGTRDAAHAKARDLIPRPAARIELVDMPTDKETILDVLHQVAPSVTILRTWALTDRGGLREVPNGD